MSSYQTAFGSLDKHEKGVLTIINDDPKNYCFSNIFEVASKSKPYEKVAVGKNLEYVIEAVRAEGASDWYAANHDEFVLVMDGDVTVTLVDLANAVAVVAAGKEGTVKLASAPQGKKMGTIRLKRGHQALLPKGAAYQFSAPKPSVMLWQTIVGDLTVQKWREICAHQP
jgi:hypothetical protein